MLKLINKNLVYFNNLEYSNKSNKYHQAIINNLEKEKLIIITGLKWIWKNNIVSNIIQDSIYKNNYLYISKKFDLLNNINSFETLKKLLSVFIMEYKTPKLIILDNLSSIPELKTFLNFLYKQDYKIIIIWNNIQIWNKPEIEISGEHIDEYKKTEKQENTIQILKTKDIIFEEIIKSYSLKNFDLYNYTISFISKNNKYSSVREINRNLNNIIKVSLVTMMEYIKYSLSAKIIKQSFVFDFKKNKKITSKTKYYFTDINLRNSLYNFELSENLLKENFLYNELYKKWYSISWWNNWSYDFDFYANKILTNTLPWEKQKINTIYIDFCKSTDKKEIKKQIKKLLKVPEIIYISEGKSQSFTQTFSKYLIVENTDEIWIKKLQYENLKIVSLNELLKII